MSNPKSKRNESAQSDAEPGSFLSKLATWQGIIALLLTLIAGGVGWMVIETNKTSNTLGSLQAKSDSYASQIQNLTSESLNARNQLSDINRSVGEIELKVDTNIERVDRISARLPDIQIKVSEEIVQSQLAGAIITSNPFEKIPSSDDWTTVTWLLEPGLRKGTRLELSANGMDDPLNAFMVSGIVVSYPENGTYSFELLKSLFLEARSQPLMIPGHINPKGSYVFHRLSPLEFADLSKQVELFVENSGLVQLEVSSEFELADQPKDIQDLIKQLQDNPAFSTLPEDQP